MPDGTKSRRAALFRPTALRCGQFSYKAGVCVIFVSLTRLVCCGALGKM